MKRKFTLILVLIFIPLLIFAKNDLYERYDEDIESLFNVLIQYDNHDEVFKFFIEHANITGPHLNVFNKIINEKITSYEIIENHFINGCGMYYIFVKTKRDPEGDYFWLQCCNNSMTFIY